MTEEEQVHCLVCDDVYIEPHGTVVEVCPSCGNDDVEQTVYLEPDSECREPLPPKFLYSFLEASKWSKERY